MNTTENADYRVDKQRTRNRTMSLALMAVLTFAPLCLLPKTSEAGSCGANGQRPCTVWERIPSCDSGLVEDLARGKCVRITPTTPTGGGNNGQTLHCGADNQRPCRLWERTPSCDSGLFEDIGKDRCVWVGSSPEAQLPSTSQSETTVLRLCNSSSDSKMWAAYGYWEQASASWTTEGHWTLTRGKCIDHDLGQYEGAVYLYGSDADGGSWGGEGATLCIDATNAFEIHHADTTNCSGATQEWVGTTKFELVPGINKWNYY